MCRNAWRTYNTYVSRALSFYLAWQARQALNRVDQSISTQLVLGAHHVHAKLPHMLYSAGLAQTADPSINHSFALGVWCVAGAKKRYRFRTYPDQQQLQ